MRMARLKAVNLFEEKCEMVASPANFEFEIVGKKVSVASKHTDWYTLDMPLSEAVEELNAAMLHGSGVPEGYDILYMKKTESPLDWSARLGNPVDDFREGARIIKEKSNGK